MARLLMSPEDMQARRLRALELFEDGESSLRAVAAAVGAHHSSVSDWYQEAKRTGELPEPKFDRHATGGDSWDDERALRRQATRAVRKQRGAGPKRSASAHDPSSPSSEGVTAPDDVDDWRPRRKPRARIMGAELRRYLGLPTDVDEKVERSTTERLPVAEEEPFFALWAVPPLRIKIRALLEHAGGARGLTIHGLRRQLGDAFEIDDTAPESWKVDAVLEQLLPHWGFVQSGDRYWRVPQAPQ
jgi:transposase-like protein